MTFWLCGRTGIFLNLLNLDTPPWEGGLPPLPPPLHAEGVEGNRRGVQGFVDS